MLPQQKPPIVVDTPQGCCSNNISLWVRARKGDEVNEYGRPAVKVQSRVFGEPARWITCEYRDIYLADLEQSIQHLRRMPVEPDLESP